MIRSYLHLPVRALTECDKLHEAGQQFVFAIKCIPQFVFKFPSTQMFEQYHYMATDVTCRIILDINEKKLRGVLKALVKSFKKLVYHPPYLVTLLKMA